MTPQLLDARSFPLRGSALIEASAGTGKTFTIAALYLRLVLGHGGAHAAFARALTPPEILVVTFTEAATKELRDRIRARLAQAADAFLHEGELDDPLLQALRADYPPAEWPARAQQLRVAADWMDEAAVSTIHGWCNRMLREHAFDSGMLFDQALQADQVELQEEAVRDYWRTFFYPLPAEDAACIAQWWQGPADLRQALKNLLPHVQQLDGQVPCGDALRQARAERVQQLTALRAPFVSWCDELQQLLDEAVQAKRVHGTRLQGRHYKGWLQQLRDWCSGQVDQPALTDAAWARLTRDGLREAWKNGDEAPDHPALRALETLREQVGCLPEGKEQVLSHAACWVAARLEAEQHRRAEMGFDDLLTRLHRALHREGGERLAAVIREQFPVALIDEFQDTDPIQYGIFRAIYRPEAPRADTALVLIGDPKQAIYAFRGADIYTYLEARQAAARLATLGTNFRSTGEMVAAVNHVFDVAEQRAEGEGAFLFRSAAANPLPFLPVDARGRGERWVVQGQPQAALTCWWADEGTELGEKDYRQRMAEACAAEVVRLLTLGQQQGAGFVDGDGVLRPVKPQDMAILVNKGVEAEAVREALRTLGVRSVYLSDQENVFRTASAAEVQRLLQACAAPDDGRLVRAALGSAVLALDWQALDRLNTDELHWEAQLERFRGYRQCWQRQGVLPMLRRLLQDFDVPRRLIGERDERQLTDLLHLAELLQQASALLDGEHALVRYLAEQREESAVAADTRQLRLESDAELLKVVTVHKSKGLEYPLVFVPFAAACRPVKDSDVPLKWHDADGRLHVSLRPDAAMRTQAERERLGEDLRKLYVALTRARFATWIGVAPTAEVQRTALGYLLRPGGRLLAPGQVQDVLQAALGPCAAVSVAPAPPMAAQGYRAETEQLQLAPEPSLPAAPPERWWVASYSRLRRSDERSVAATAQEDTYLDEPEAGDDAVAPAQPAAAGTLHAFPRGAAPGTFLHGLLEVAGRKGFAAAADQPQELAALLARRCQASRWAPHRAALQDWLARWLAEPLQLGRLTAGASAVAPRDLRAIQPEMEFWLAAAQVDTRALDDLVCAHTLRGVPRARLQPERLNGMLKGFIDLVFEHEGRYYVADYKSNWLGPADEDYTVEAMRDVVLHHRYELQYSLYLFALHRLLRARLPDYDYDRHVGGAVYIFLRGHASATQGLHLERPPRALMEALDGLFAGAEVAA
jgi:exodeoxyribonuclease V beta subunit